MKFSIMIALLWIQLVAPATGQADEGDEHSGTSPPPAAVERFAQVLADHKGLVLVHCTVAWRASYLWVACLIRYQDYSLDEAYARGRAIGIGPNRLAELLDRPLKLIYTEDG